MSSSYLIEFQTRIANHDTPAVLRLWEEYCSGDEADPKELRDILVVIKTSEVSEFVGRHVERILPLWKQLEETPTSKEILKLVIDLESSNNELLRELAFEYLKINYGSQPTFNEKIRLIGLRSKENFQGAISHFELLNHMQKGNFVFHTGGWGVGEILDVSLLREQLSLEFDFVSGKKDLSFANAFKTLIPIPKDHFLALRFGNPDLLEEKARENPLETIRMLLRDLGPKTAAEIKDELCDLIIPAKEWTRWWQNARAKIKKDTFIYTPEDLRENFRILTSEISHEERLKKTIENADPASLIQLAYSFIKDFSETLKKEEFKTFLQNKFNDVLTFPELSDAQKLQFNFFLQDLGESKASKTIEESIKSYKSIQDIIKNIDILSFKKRVMIETKKARSDWKDIFADLLFTVEQTPLRDYLLGELLGDPETLNQLKKGLQDLCAFPGRNPEMFIWYFQKVMANPALPLGDSEGKARLFESLLVLLSNLEHTGQNKEAIKKIHTILTNDRFLIVRQIMQIATVADVKEFLLLATKCHSLSDHDIKILHSLAEVAHPTLAKANKKSESSSDAQVIWMTQEGYQKLQTRIHKIATVETVENAKEIEVARAHGDLRENMEFKAAREKRDRLQSELKTLSDQMSKARVITKEDISADEVGIGALVDCENTKGLKVTYAILGPWEADPEKNILSFQSKLAQSMKGLSVGDKFQFQDDEYKIVAIRNYLEQKK